MVPMEAEAERTGSEKPQNFSGNEFPEENLTNETENEQELGRISIEAEVNWLRVQDGADQVTFGGEKPCRGDDRSLPLRSEI